MGMLILIELSGVASAESSYIINASGANQNLKDNGTFTQTRFNPDCYDISLSSNDYESNGNLTFELTGRCNNTRDNSNQENDGTNSGSEWNSSRLAFEFLSAESDYISLGDITDIDGATSLLVTAEIKIPSVGYHFIATKGDCNTGLADEAAFNFGVQDTSGIYFRVSDGTTQKKLYNTPVLSTNTWINVTANWDGENVSIYYNGTLQKTETDGGVGGLLANSDNLYVGRCEVNPSYFNGLIRNLRIFTNRIFSYNDISNFQEGINYYASGNVTYNNIDIGSKLLDNVTINFSRDSSGAIVNFYVDDISEETNISTNTSFDISGSYTGIINISLEFIKGTTDNVESIQLFSSEPQICYCSNCVECKEKLNNSCSVVLLNESINDYSGSCIDSVENFNNKVFDCNGNIIDGINEGYYAIILFNNYNNTIKNCVSSNFISFVFTNASNHITLYNNSVYSNVYYGFGSGIFFYEGNTYFNISNNNFSNNEVGIYGYKNSSFNNVENNIIYNSTTGGIIFLLFQIITLLLIIL